jgi:diacylglycerol kinase family enzyme
VALPGFHIVFNASAGAVLKAGQASIEHKITASRIHILSLGFFSSAELPRRLRKLKHTGQPILIGGGDGTLMRIAGDFLDAPGQLGILPMGTMNLLANDLGLPIGLEDALKAYAGGVTTQEIDVGSVNNVFFLCCVALGVIPEASAFREANRGQAEIFLIPRLAMFVFGRLDKTRRRFHVRLDGNWRRIRTPILIISNNLLKADTVSGDHAFKKQALVGGELGVYSLLPPTVWDKLRMLLRLQFGNWKKDPKLVEHSGRSVEVRTVRREEEVAVDGETHRLVTPLRFIVLPRALTLLVPRAMEGGGAAA